MATMPEPVARLLEAALVGELIRAGLLLLAAYAIVLVMGAVAPTVRLFLG